MQRAAVLIGVSRSGTLPVLPAVIPSVKAMERWALQQGMSRELVKTLTDEAGPLEPGAIKTAIKELVDMAVVEQLIVYFSGHGVNIRYGEYWLLSNAPNDTQAAVNVAGSVELARFCGIPHIIFFSDACRTAPEGIQAQYVSGSEIFPNNGPGGLENSVDLFFACTLGRPAYEIQDPASSASAFTAIYTEALVSALAGRNVEIVVPEESMEGLSTSVSRTGLVRPRKLKEHLRREVVEKLRLLDKAMAVYQEPDGRITSEENAWVSRVPLVRTRSFPKPPAKIPTTLQDVSARVLQEALHSDPITQAAHVERLLREFAEVPGADEFGRLIHDNIQGLGPDQFETHWGFKVRGTHCVDAYAPRFGTEVLSDQAELPEQLVSVYANHNDASDRTMRADNVLLTLEDGSSVVLPAIPEFLATVSVKNGEIVDVAYEPSANSSLWPMYRDQMEELRLLRSIASSSAYLGLFRLNSQQASELARRMQVGKAVDPAISLYAAYAYQDLGERSRIRQLHTGLEAEFGVSLFDVAMLAGNTPKGSDVVPGGHRTSPGIVPFVPLLSPGWSLLNAHGTKLHASLDGLTPHLRQSLWTSFDEVGTSIIRSAMESEAHA